MGGLGKKILFKGMALYDVFEPSAHSLELRIWMLRGRPLPPPPAFKQRTVMAYARTFSLTTLVETGTFLGDMARAASRVLDRVISVEFDPGLYGRARRRLGRFANVTLLPGDSGAVLHGLVPSLSRPCLFWLDAHYSGRLSGRGPLDTPIVRELEAVLSPSGPEHVILIDDARCFTGAGDYPKVEDVRRFVLDRRPAWTFEVKDDIIRCHGRPRGAGPPSRGL